MQLRAVKYNSYYEGQGHTLPSRTQAMKTCKLESRTDSAKPRCMC